MLAFSSKHPYVPPANRWVASLSDGSTVFEDRIAGIQSAWCRLKEYIKSTNITITNLRLELQSGNFIALLPYKDKNGLPQIDGYWQASKIGGFLNANYQEIYWRGIGYIVDKKIFITWIKDDGSISHETREFNNNDFGVILNEV